MKTQLGTKLNLAQRLSILLFGVTKTKKRSRPGWSGELYYYAFKCLEHGVVEDYPHGFDQRLECPLCVKYYGQYSEKMVQTIKNI